MQLAARFRQWLFRTGADDPSPLTLTQRRIFILPSRVGMLFALVLTVMYAGAVNYNLGLGHALVFLLASLGNTGLVYSFRNLFGLRILAGRASPVFAGETASFAVRFENERNQPRPALRVSAGNDAPEIDFVVPAKASIAIEIPCSATRRGWQALGRLRLSTRFPLGLFFAWSYPQPPMRCLVYPQPLAFPLPIPQPARRPGRHGSTAGDEDFAGLRTRQPGDSPRHIAWKSFARDPEHRPLLVKQFAGGNEPECWLDWHELPTGMDVETRLSVMTGWVLRLEGAGSRYGLRLPGREITPAHGESHAMLCLKALALFGSRDDDADPA